MYCESDDARLCFDCDAKVHGANFLVARHCRTLLCRICHGPTPWKAEGPRLGPTLSLCHNCLDGKTSAIGNDNKKVDDEVGEDEYEEEEESEEEDEGDEQVVPETGEEPPVASSSSCSSSTEEEDEINEDDEKVGENFDDGRVKKLEQNVLLDLLSNSQDRKSNFLLPFKRATNDSIQAVNEEDDTSRPYKLQKNLSMLLPD